MAIDDTLAEAQTRLYALANSDPDGARCIELLAIHGLIGGAVYDAMPKETTAANAMLAALKTALDAMQDALDGGEYWQENFAGSDIPAVKAAIAAAKAAGIGEA